MEEAVVMMVGLETKRIQQALNILKYQKRGKSRSIQKVIDYSAPNVSEKVVRIIHSYTNYIKQKVWREYI